MQTTYIQQGKNTISIDKAEQLEKGIYFVKTTVNNHTKVNTVIKH
ncbi:MAG: hypothetical protein V4590_06825 [Bacteroidota bacterium]